MSLTTAFSRRGMAVLALLCTAAAAPAMGQEPTQAQQKEHVVRKGDTLWDLARQYLDDPFRWPLIFDANKQVVENPHWIYPAEKLVIPGMQADQVAVAVAEQPARAPQRTRFYAPVTTAAGPTLISTERESANLVQVSEWLAAPWISDSAALGINAEITKPLAVRNQDDKLRQTFHPYDELILGTEADGIQPGDRLLVVRLTRNVRDLGWEVVPQGVLLVDSIGPRRAVATITTQFADLMVGDMTMPLPAAPAMPEDKLTPVSGGPIGELIAFVVEQPLVGTTEYGFVSLGAAQGIAIGDELIAFIPARRISQNTTDMLPEQEVGRLRVIRVTDDVSTVRVLGLKNAVLREGLPVRVARKAP
ncbi:MAG: LysM peptidoglycan-binding domain-containing protein [Gemmatimonadota bacterium]